MLAAILILNDFYAFYKLKQSSIYILFTIQAIGLIIGSIFYYIDIFRSPSVSNLKKQPLFLTIMGISFFMLCTLPYSIAVNSLKESNPFITQYLFSIFYIFYCFLFLMIIKALLCKPVIGR